MNIHDLKEKKKKIGSTQLSRKKDGIKSLITSIVR